MCLLDVPGSLSCCLSGPESGLSHSSNLSHTWTWPGSPNNHRRQRAQLIEGQAQSQICQAKDCTLRGQGHRHCPSHGGVLLHVLL
jgi:hypothetical protein